MDPSTRRFRTVALSLALLTGGLPALQAAELAQVSLAAPPAASASGDAASKDGAKSNPLRILLGYAVTSAIKYGLGGVGPARFLPYLSGLSPAVSVSTLLGLGLAEAGASIFVFNKIAGIKKDDRKIMAFLLAAAASTMVTPLLTGWLGPLGGTLVSNAARLFLYNLIARDVPGKESTDPSSLAADRQKGSLGTPGLLSAPADDLLEHRTFGAAVAGNLAELKRRADNAYQQVVQEGARVTQGSWSRYLAARQGFDLALERALGK